MAEFTANAVQNVAVGQNVVLTDTPVKGNCSIMHRDGSGIVKLRGIVRNTGGCNCNKFARFNAFFNANVAIPADQTAAPLLVALTIDGEPVGTTTAEVTPTNNGYWNVSASIYIDVPANCCETIGIRNISTIPINIRNTNLIVDRVV